jgi:hypothetical protein
MQHEVTTRQDLLDRNGRIREEGWARRPVWTYQRDRIKAGKMRIKEWDYYAFTSTKGGWTVALTISDLGYGALFAIAFIDYKRGKFSQVDSMKFFTFHRTGFAPSSTEDNQVTIADDKLRLAFIKKGQKRQLVFGAPSLVLPDGSVGLDGNVTLHQTPTMESMNIATSWEKNRKAFYLNEKVNCMRAEGYVRMGETERKLEKDDVWGVLDWGRGRWTYQNQWYWGSASGLVDGVPFGFNIGYGFSDRTPASENVLFYDGTAHKLEEVDFGIPKEGFMDNWNMTSIDGRFTMKFEPAVDRVSNTDFLIIKSVQNQVFGYFTGNAVLDDGKIIHLDHFPGFAEQVFNRW